MAAQRIRSILCTAVVFVLFSAAAALAQQSSGTPAPIPTGIASATKLFVSNAGADAGLFPEPFTGDPSRGYNQLYIALKSSGQYQLVGDPSDADLVLELRLTAPYGPSNANKVQGASDPRPMFTLTVYDRKTHYVLWTLTHTIEVAFLQKTHDRNFDEALAAMVSQFEALSGKQAPATP